MGKITQPHALTPEHELLHFSCEEPALDNWLKNKALKNQYLGASRTFVVCDDNKYVIAYYSLATGSIDHKDTIGKVRRNMPDPIPVMLLGRLAVDKQFKSQELGAGLLKDAILRTISVAQHVGIRAILVHALSEQAKLFYKHHGFYESKTENLTLMITLDEARKYIVS